METSPLFWILFNLSIIGLLLLDLLVLNRKAHAVTLRESLLQTAGWVTLALGFNYYVYRYLGHEAGLQWLTGYLVEEALSVDNLFVFLLIFNYFKVPAEYQHRVLFWGILGALVLRALFILLGSALLAKFHFLFYVLGAFLVYTGVRMALSGGADPEVDPHNNPVVRFLRRYLPVAEEFDGGNFFTERQGVRYATPLLVVLAMIETTDVVFAADSIPAILAISRNTFIVYTSNVFAVLGLRSLYFALSRLMAAFHYLSYGLALILIFIGLKLLGEDFLRARFNL
ncbi:MAG: TerC family protein, partial [Deltaproteobacteria bacterium]